MILLAKNVNKLVNKLKVSNLGSDYGFQKLHNY